MMHINRKSLCFKIISSLVVLCFSAGDTLASPSITIDVATGKVLQSEDAFARWSPASLTKLMTAYVTFRALASGEIELTSPVRISSAAANEPPSRMGYSVGSIMTVDNAIKMLIIKSANDVSVALAEAVSGTETEFAARMNREAARLGMADTNFVNANGLHDAAQYTTARDLAVLARAIRSEFPQYDHYFSAEGIRTGDTVTASYNILLGRFDGADGMKTGFVCASGFNIAASATRNERTLVAVVLGEPSQKARAEKSANLLQEGFATMADDPSLLRLSEYVPQSPSTTVANLRSQVCTEEARANRWDGRQVEGFLVFASPYIGQLSRPPNALTAGLGGAEGASRSAIVLGGSVIKAYPVPSPKPERISLVEGDDLVKYQLRPGFDVPVPAKRP